MSIIYYHFYYLKLKFFLINTCHSLSIQHHLFLVLLNVLFIQSNRYLVFNLPSCTGQIYCYTEHSKQLSQLNKTKCLHLSHFSQHQQFKEVIIFKDHLKLKFDLHAILFPIKLMDILNHFFQFIYKLFHQIPKILLEVSLHLMKPMKLPDNLYFNQFNSFEQNSFHFFNFIHCFQRTILQGHLHSCTQEVQLF